MFFKSHIILKRLPKRSLSGKPLPLHRKSFKSSIYLKIKIAIILNNNKITFRGLGINSISLIYIIKAQGSISL